MDKTDLAKTTRGFDLGLEKAMASDLNGSSPENQTATGADQCGGVRD